MKKIIVALAICFFIVNVNAQIKKGTILLGGQVNANTGKVKTESISGNSSQINNGVSVGFSFGKAIKENTIVGVGLNTSFYNSNAKNTNDSNYNKFNSVGANIFYRKYKKLGKDFYIFVEPSVGFNTGKQTITNTPPINTNSSKFAAFNLNLNAGLSYKLYKKLQLEVSLPNLLGMQYSQTNYDQTNAQFVKQISKQFTLNTGLNSELLNNLSLGFRLFL